MTQKAHVAALAVAAILWMPAHAATQHPASPGQPDIHDAALKGDLQAVKVLLARDPALLGAEKAPNKKTPLHYAAQGGHKGVVEFLLDEGAEVNRPNIAGETPLHYAVSAQAPEVTVLLLVRGADPNARTQSGRTPIGLATAWGRPATIKALIEHGADPRQTTGDGQTLLHVSATNGPAEAIALFVSKGVAVDAVSRSGETPLLSACTAGNLATAKAILEQGADPNRADAKGRYPLTLAVGSGRPEFVKLLLDAGAKPDPTGPRGTRSPLHVAAAQGYRRIVEMLLLAGADRDARDGQGRTALDLATANGNTGVVAALHGGAGGPGAAASRATTLPLKRPLEEGEATVWYLGHLGWAVKTANHLLVFDYDGRAVPPEEPSLAGGWINPEEIKDLPTTVFISHGHRDHYAPAVFDWKATVKDITYVAGFKPEGKDGYVFMTPRETRKLGGLDITTTLANDEGVGFFVTADGVTIFHSGDHANWAGEDASFKPEIDFLAGRGLRAHLLFMPVSVTNEAVMNEGVHYAIRRLDAGAVFPGHARGREHMYGEFARAAANAGISAPIHCAELGGDRFTVTASTLPDDRAVVERTIRDSIGWALKKDRPLLERIIAHDEDLFMFNPDSKPTIGWDAFAKNFDFWMDPRFKATSLDVRELRVRYSPSRDVAWWSAILDDLAEWDGKPVGWKDTRWTGVLEKRDGAWVIVQMHFSFASDKVRAEALAGVKK